MHIYLPNGCVLATSPVFTITQLTAQRLQERNHTASLQALLLSVRYTLNSTVLVLAS